MTPYRGYLEAGYKVPGFQAERWLTPDDNLMGSETQLSKMTIVVVGLAGIIIIGVAYELFKRYRR